MNRGNDGQEDGRRLADRQFTNTLSILKRRDNNKSGITINDANCLTPNKNTDLRTERTRLPTIWRSGSGSWDIQASLPKRISSKLWSQSRTVSETIPEANVPMAVFKERGTGGEVDISTDNTLGAGKYRANSRTTLRKSKLDTSAELGRRRAHDTRQVLITKKILL